jgi:four helix bundle protein
MYAWFPKEELYGITNQLRWAASSIEANIAEGCGRKSDTELARFLQIARGLRANWNAICS